MEGKKTCPTPIPQPTVSTTPIIVRTWPVATLIRCPAPKTHKVPQQSSSSGNLSIPFPASQPECHKTEFKHMTTLLLLELTRTYTDLYHQNKIAFYKKLEKEFIAKGYKLTGEKIRKKLGNMLTTYKRAKDRSQTTGEGKITWEYYWHMNEIFGVSRVGSEPPGTTVSIPLFPSQSSQSPSGDQPCGTDDQETGPLTTTRSEHATRQGATAQKKGRRSSFLDTYESHAERRTTALESLVRPEMARWRRLKEKRRRGFEKKMLTCMGEIVSQLKELGKQQQKIIYLLEESNTK